MIKCIQIYSTVYSPLAVIECSIKYYNGKTLSHYCMGYCINVTIY